MLQRTALATSSEPAPIADAGRAAGGAPAAGAAGESDTAGAGGEVDISEQVRPVTLGAGINFSCVLQAGKVKCWGGNWLGQLGTQTNAGELIPNFKALPVDDLGAPVTGLACGALFACALLEGGNVKCWGQSPDHIYQLPSDYGPYNAAPLLVTGFESPLALTSGGYHVCAINGDHSVSCWGPNQSGATGDPTTIGMFHATTAFPKRVAGLDPDVVQVSAGFGHTCALSRNGAVTCWGMNLDGQLGSLADLGASSATPRAVEGLHEPALQISAGWTHTCAAMQSGAVMCWGSNEFGQLGSATPMGKSPKPVRVSGIKDAVQVVAANTSSCALTGSGKVWCWGENDSGQLGNPRGAGSKVATLDPLPVVGLGGPVSELGTSGYTHLCARLVSGSIKCWGENADGALGHDTSPDTYSVTPQTVGGLP